MSKQRFNLLIGAIFALFCQFVAAASLTDYYENVVADHLFRGTALSESVPASYYVALYTTACSDSTPGTEVTGGSYARVAIARSQAAWTGTHGTTTGASSGDNGTISNAAAATFPAPTADWTPTTQIGWFGILDASTAGNQIICSALTTPKSVNNGDSAPSFGIGALTIQFDN